MSSVHDAVSLVRHVHGSLNTTELALSCVRSSHSNCIGSPRRSLSASYHRALTCHGKSEIYLGMLHAIPTPSQHLLTQ
jgi:hypothetical protein